LHARTQLATPAFFPSCRIVRTAPSCHNYQALAM